MMPGQGGDVNTTLPLILSIITLLCNCLFGIPALVLAILAMNEKKAGKLDDARSKAKISLILSIVGWVIGIVFGILNAVFGFLGNS
jgi:hypothetical protein